MTMRGRSWIRQQRLAEAQELTEQIIRLEQELLVPKGAKLRELIEVGYQIRTYKRRLCKLERCISALQSCQSAT
ncbi:conserved hypothetical protein [Mesorhizobium plurifarium]|uniref:Uncharacterized protein n=1 Tax=Mesorhizobium plurifarium TaxID=69974 RepID=A0A090GIN5_MESPL|nr:conserved hypothetical protein [Mesorhizobium plurifarium]